MPIRPVLTMIVGDEARFREDVYPGRAKATQEVNISFEISGKMIKRNFDIGAAVKKGDLLAVLEPDRYRSEVKRLKAERAAASAVLENAEQQLARHETLLKEGYSPQARVDRLRAEAQATGAKVSAVRAALERAELDLSHTRVYAPFDGTVAETFVENFQNVLAKQPIMRLLDTSLIEMEVAVPEALIGLAPYVQDIQVRFKVLPDVSIPAKIKEIGNEASQTTRTYPVTVIMAQPEGTEIKPGMAGEAIAEVELPEGWTKQGIEVPVSAVFSPENAEEKEVFVWTVNEDESVVSRQPVKILSTSSRGVRITGVEPGQRIVVAGASFLSDGQKIRIMAK